MLIKNCNLIDMENIFKEIRDIRLKAGKIVEVGENLIPEPEEEILDAEGKLVTPGLVELHSQVGTRSQVHRFDLADSEDADPAAPSLRALDAINFQDAAFEMATNAGVTTLVCGPSIANVIGGTCAAVKTAGENIPERILSEEVCYQFSLANAVRKKFAPLKKLPTTRMGSAAVLRDYLTKAREYHRKAQTGVTQDYNLEMASLARVLDGMPVEIVATRSNDMETAIRIAEEFGLRYILTSALDAAIVCKDLERKDLPLAVGPLYGHNNSVESRNRSLSLAHELDQQGIEFALTTGHPAMNIEMAALHLAMIHQKGFSQQKALRAVTILPAKMLGLDDRIGSIAPGKDADLVIWQGDPFDYYAKVAHLIVNGQIYTHS